MLIAEEEEAEAGVGELCIKSPAMFQGYWRNPNVRAPTSIIVILQTHFCRKDIEKITGNLLPL